jgi:hypothetical protein
MDSRKVNSNSINNYLTLEVNCATEAIAILLELRKQHFFSFRGQRNTTWNLGPHKIKNNQWENKPKEMLWEDAKRKDEENLLRTYSVEEEKKYWRGKSVRYHINENLQQFLRYGKEIIPGKFNDSDWWNNIIFAQHYGLKTLLLDWTSNPLVALYFAVENIISSEDDDCNGAVYAIKVKSEGNGKRWYNFSDVKQLWGTGELCPYWIMINPDLNNDRIIRQSGKFTYHPSIDDRELIDNPKNRNSNVKLAPDEALVKIIISPKCGKNNPTAEIRHALGIMNIHHGSLFPDCEGVAHFINQEWRTIATEDSWKKEYELKNITDESLQKVGEIRKFVDKIVFKDDPGEITNLKTVPPFN